MKKYALLLSVLMASNVALATNYGASCGLIDAADDLVVVKASEIMLDETVVEALTTRQKQQIIVGAKYLLSWEGPQKFKNTAEAINALLEAGGDSYLDQITVDGKVFDRVIFYPGDNASGVVFEKDTLKIIASIQDSDVVCE